MKLYTILLAGSLASTTFDVESTFHVMKRCPSCVEANPLMRPFMDNRASAYGVAGGITAGTSYASWELKKRGSRWWWVPLAVSIGVHAAAGVHNSRLERGVR